MFLENQWQWSKFKYIVSNVVHSLSTGGQFSSLFLTYNKNKENRLEEIIV